MDLFDHRTGRPRSQAPLLPLASQSSTSTAPCRVPSDRSGPCLWRSSLWRPAGRRGGTREPGGGLRATRPPPQERDGSALCQAHTCSHPPTLTFSFHLESHRGESSHAQRPIRPATKTKNAPAFAVSCTQAVWAVSSDLLQRRREGWALARCASAPCTLPSLLPPQH
jgi:hypothetical protein